MLTYCGVSARPKEKEKVQTDQTKIMQCSFKYMCFAILAVGVNSQISANSANGADHILGGYDDESPTAEELRRNGLECSQRMDGAPCTDHMSSFENSVSLNSVCLDETCVPVNRTGACALKFNNDVCTYAGVKGRCQIFSSPNMVDGTDRFRIDVAGVVSGKAVGYKLAETQQTLGDAPAVGPLECYSGHEVVAKWNKQQCNFAEPSVTEGKRCTIKQYIGLTQAGTAEIMVPTTELDAKGKKPLDELVLEPENQGVQIIGDKESFCETQYSYFSYGHEGYTACGETDSEADLACQSVVGPREENKYASGSECLDVSTDDRTEVPCIGMKEGAACSYEKIDEVVWECGWQKDTASASTIEILLAQMANNENVKCDSSGTEKTGWKKCTVPGKCWATPKVVTVTTYEMETVGTFPSYQVRKQKIGKYADIYTAEQMEYYGYSANKTFSEDIPIYTTTVSEKDALYCTPAEELREEDLVCVENNVNPAYANSPSSTLASSAFVVAVCGALHAVATIV